MHSVYPTRVAAERDRPRVTHTRGAARPVFDDAVGLLRGARGATWGEELARSVERLITLQVIDTRWREHLDNMDYLRQGIGLRGYAQKDPLVEYRREGQAMFGEMSCPSSRRSSASLMHAEVEVERAPELRPAARRARSTRTSSASMPPRSPAWRPIAGADSDAEPSDGLPVVEQRQRSTPSATSAATTRAGAAAARSTSGAMAHSVAGGRARVSLDDLRAAVEELRAPAALGP